MSSASLSCFPSPSRCLAGALGTCLGAVGDWLAPGACRWLRACDAVDGFHIVVQRGLVIANPGAAYIGQLQLQHGPYQLQVEGVQGGLLL